MKTFDLELRVKTFGSILTWEIFLEDSTDQSKKVLDWLQETDYRYKKLPGYNIEDESLDVYASCRGISGGSITCEVLIKNISQDKKVISKVKDKEYAHSSYII